MSRSMRRRSFSRLSRRISSCSTITDDATAKVGFIPASRTRRASSLRCQRRSSESWMPRSLATWLTGWPSTVTSRTASALNSFVNARRLPAISHLRSDHTELVGVSARPGEDHLLQLRDNTLGPVLHDRYHRHAEGELVGHDTKLLDAGRSSRELGSVEDLVADAEAKVLLDRHRFQTNAPRASGSMRSGLSLRTLPTSR